MATITYATTNTLVIAFHDGLGELITPTANFTPASGYPLSNLTNSQLMSRCRTPDLTTDRQLTWDFGSGLVTFNIFMLTGCNATLNTTRRFRASSDSIFTIGVVESGSSLDAAFDSSLGNVLTYVPPWGRTMIYIHSSTVSKRYIRWHQSDALNPDGYQEWGVARIGVAWQPAYGYETYRAIPSLSGPVGSQIALRGLEVQCHNLTRDEAYDLQSIYLTALNSKRLLVIPEPNLPATYLHDALWCTIEGSYVREVQPISTPSDRRYRVVTTFREADR